MATIYPSHLVYTRTHTCICLCVWGGVAYVRARTLDRSCSELYVTAYSSTIRVTGVRALIKYKVFNIIPYLRDWRNSILGLPQLGFGGTKFGWNISVIQGFVASKRICWYLVCCKFWLTLLILWKKPASIELNANECISTMKRYYVNKYSVAQKVRMSVFRVWVILQIRE